MLLKLNLIVCVYILRYINATICNPFIYKNFTSLLNDILIAVYFYFSQYSHYILRNRILSRARAFKP